MKSTLQTLLSRGFYPFWFWNDRLTGAEIRWQVAQMAAQGVKGFFIHPRQGLQQPYLSNAFFEMVDEALAAAKEHDMIVHLYDEYPYPSGIAGGEVVLGNPHYYATALIQKSYTVPGGPVRLALPRGKVLACMAYPAANDTIDWNNGIDLWAHVGPVLAVDSYRKTGLTAYNQKRYFASEPTPTLEATLPEGPHEIFLSVQTEVHHHKYWHHFTDVLNPEAVARFIDLTHERYQARYGAEFGRQIASIFVDETMPGWSERIPAAFEATYGYDLLAALPALQHPDHPHHTQVTYDLYQLRYQLFCQAFEQPISSWCQEHGLAYSGEKPSLRMAQLRYMDIPGCEPGHTKVGAKLDVMQGRLRGNAKATASAAYFYDKAGSLCECYHSTGWSATLQDAKFIGEALLLMGIKYLVPHGFFYSTHALKKHDAPPTFFFQMPAWPLFGRLSERINRLDDLFVDTFIDAQILVVDPASGAAGRDDLQRYEALLWQLMAGHLDFHIVDTDILRAGQIADGDVRVADLTAKAVVVPSMPVVEEPLQDWLQEFSTAGGTVIFCQPTTTPEQLRQSLLPVVQPSLSIQVDGQEASGVLVVKRAAPDKTLWFILNTSDQTVSAQLNAGSDLREVALNDDVPIALVKTGGHYTRQIAPFESLVLETAPTVEPPALPQIRVMVGGEAELRPEQDNLLRLYDWQMALIDENDEVGPAYSVPAITLAEQLAHSQMPFSPHFNRYFGSEPEMAFPELRVQYQTRFELAYDGPVQLVMEPGSIGGDWAIFINDHPPLEPQDFSPSEAHVRGSLGVDISALLQPGQNTIQVEVVGDRSDGGLLNPLYLAGAFGVRLDPIGLVPPKSTGHFERYEENLLPYYAGVIEYTTRFTLDSVPHAEQVLVQFAYEQPFHEATEVSINGSPYQPVLWQPRFLKVAAEHLTAGENILKTKVYTTLIRSFEGQWFDYDSHQYRDVGASS